MDLCHRHLLHTNRTPRTGCVLKEIVMVNKLGSTAKKIDPRAPQAVNDGRQTLPRAARPPCPPPRHKSIPGTGVARYGRRRRENDIGHPNTHIHSPEARHVTSAAPHSACMLNRAPSDLTDKRHLSRAGLYRPPVSSSLTSHFSTNMAISETKGQGLRAISTQ